MLGFGRRLFFFGLAYGFENLSVIAWLDAARIPGVARHQPAKPDSIREAWPSWPPTNTSCVRELPPNFSELTAADPWRRVSSLSFFLAA